MGLFRRRKPATVQATDPRAGIADFWQWWAVAAAELADAIPMATVNRYVDVMTAHVSAIDPGLAWEFAPGRTSRHQLTVTAEGDPELRRVARQWLRAAPPPDRIWSFHDLRQPGPLGFRLRIGGVDLDMNGIRVAGSRRGSGLDVIVHHPLFASLPQQVQAQIAFLSLDTALGEEAVELWIGGVGRSPDDPPGSRPLAELPAMVAEVVADGMPDGSMGWTMLRGEGPRGPLLVTRLNRLSPVQAPQHDQHAAVRVPFSDQTAAGLPGPGSLDALRAFENHLTAIVKGSGQLVAVETSGGFRTLHYYVDSGTPAAAQLEAATRGWEQGRVGVEARRDPAWEAVRCFRD